MASDDNTIARLATTASWSGSTNSILFSDCKLRAPSAPPLEISVGLLYQSLDRDYVINSRKSLRDLRGRWNKHLKEVFASISADSLTTQQINSYISQRLAQGAANATCNRELACLKRCYKLAVKEGMLKLGDLPFVPMLREKNVRVGFVKDAQYADLARETGKIGLWLRVLFECGFNYGWRLSEVRGLRVRQIDMAEHTISLDPGTTKTDEGRTVSMTRKVRELIGPLIAGKGPDDPVFTRGRGKTFRPVKSFRKSWARATAAAGVPGLLFHDLRRSGVRNLIRAGVTEGIAMRISGHRTRKIFDRYNIVSPEDLDRAVVLMDAASLRRGSCDQPAQEPQARLPFEDADRVPAYQTRCSGMVADCNHVLVECPEMFTPARSGEKYHSEQCYQFTRHRHTAGFHLGDIYIKGEQTRPNITPEDRSRIASEAAKTRWSAPRKPAASARPIVLEERTAEK